MQSELGLFFFNGRRWWSRQTCLFSNVSETHVCTEIFFLLKDHFKICISPRCDFSRAFYFLFTLTQARSVYLSSQHASLDEWFSNCVALTTGWKILMKLMFFFPLLGGGIRLMLLHWWYAPCISKIQLFFSPFCYLLGIGGVFLASEVGHATKSLRTTGLERFIKTAKTIRTEIIFI